MCRLLSFYFAQSNYLFEHRKLVLTLLTPCLSAGWWVYTLTNLDMLTQHCYEPYPSFSLLVYFAIIVVIIPGAFLVLCVLAFLVLFCPCITWLIGRALLDERERGLLKDRVIESLAHIRYDPAKFKNQKTCCICFENFTEGDTITPLSCDIRHYFHSECITQWMKEKN